MIGIMTWTGKGIGVQVAPPSDVSASNAIAAAFKSITTPWFASLNVGLMYADSVV